MIEKNHIIFLLFWATWDLAKRKLFSSLYNLYKTETDKKIDIIAIWRREYSQEEFLRYIDKETDLFIDKSDREKFKNYLTTIIYIQLDITNQKWYLKLEEIIKSLLDKKWTSQILVYLSVWYNLFETIIKNLWILSLANRMKIIFEKPFWKDLESAIKLNNTILKFFTEEQIYRIDHYVWKESVQNILAFRFWNIFFEPLWNSNYIDNIQIIALEKIWIENRGSYYEQSGALRDMVQNHLFQILTIVIMDPPLDISSEQISLEKLKVLKELQIDKKSLVFGQYDWYRNEKNVSSTSNTETFVWMKVFVNSWRFKNLPIYLKTGKALNTKSTIVVIEFKEIPNIFYRKYWEIEKNRIIIEIQPDNKISLQFNLKRENIHNQIQLVKSEFRKIYKDDTYDRLILDCIYNNKLLFTDWSILRQSWEIVDSIINCKNDCPLVHIYKKGSKWPIQSDKLLEKDNRKWYC